MDLVSVDYLVTGVESDHRSTPGGRRPSECSAHSRVPVEDRTEEQISVGSHFHPTLANAPYANTLIHKLSVTLAQIPSPNISQRYFGNNG